MGFSVSDDSGSEGDDSQASGSDDDDDDDDGGGSEGGDSGDGLSDTSSLPSASPSAVSVPPEPPIVVEPAPSFGRDIERTAPEFPHLVVSDSTICLWGKRIVSVSGRDSISSRP
jgi:hypothetical protein